MAGAGLKFEWEIESKNCFVKIGRKARGKGVTAKEGATE
jgi:hypothetical protein